MPDHHIVKFTLTEAPAVELTQENHSEILATCYAPGHVSQSPVSWLRICLSPLCIAVQAKDYDRTKGPQLMYSMLQPNVPDPELCMKLVKLM